jgi:hypothetical protein
MRTVENGRCLPWPSKSTLAFTFLFATAFIVNFPDQLAIVLTRSHRERWGKLP